MRHLSPEQLMEVADGTQFESSLPHLASCAICRDQVAELQTLLASVAEVDVPEPSPLFWDHLSDRVRERVMTEVAAPRTSWWPGWQPWRVAAGVAIVALLVVAFMREAPGKVDPAPVRSATASSSESVVVEGPASAPDDASFGLIADLSDDVDWDAAAGSEMAASVENADSALSALSDAERVELRRLLNEAMAAGG